MSTLAIEVHDLGKTFPGGVVAVNGLDLEIPTDALYGLIGRNGAGKTTTIRMLMGLLRPDRGSARVLGADLLTAPRAVRARVAYVSQAQQLHAWMTLEELCHYASHFYEKWDTGYARDLARRIDVPWDRQVGLLSGGQQRNAAILLAFAARPDVLLLDEPAAGLDPVARRQFIDEIVDVLTRSEGCTVLFSTHILSDLERIAEYVGIMDRGRLVASGRLEDFQSKTKRVQVIFDNVSRPGFTMPVIPGTIRSHVEGPVLTAVVRLESESQLDEARRIPGVRVNVFPVGLEEMFIDLFGPGARSEFVEEGSC
jgi:ABC-2 type transport system ATP-binding protein